VGTLVDWLGDEIVSDENSDWLNVDTIEAPRSAMPYDGLRFACMRGSGRVWACDGEYMAFRPFNHEYDKKVNPAFEDRISRFRADGHFKHLGTFDEVQVYQLLDGSPWKSTVDEFYVAGQNLWKDIRHAAKLACKREWVEYVDMLEAVAVAMKAGRDPMFALQAWTDFINQVMVNVYQSQGPLPGEIRAGIQNVVQSRKGAKSGTVMATDITQSGNVEKEK
jgi:hypothetical protein